jgi:hypothetical protein
METTAFLALFNVQLKHLSGELKKITINASFKITCLWAGI